MLKGNLTSVIALFFCLPVFSQQFPGPPTVRFESDKKFRLTVRLNNNEEIRIKSPIYYDRKLNKTYLRTRDGVIFPSQTTSVTGIISRNKSVIGIPADSLWLFEIIKGELSCYARYPLLSGSGIIYLKKDSVFVKNAKGVIPDMLQDKPRAYRYYRTNKTVYLTSVAVFLGAGGLFAFGIVKGDDNLIKYPLLIGLTASIPAGLTKNYRINAIRFYNKI